MTLDAAAAHEKKKNEASVNNLFEQLIPEIEQYERSHLACSVRLLGDPLFTEQLILTTPRIPPSAARSATTIIGLRWKQQAWRTEPVKGCLRNFHSRNLERCAFAVSKFTFEVLLN
jgi:hypothetical protein